MTHECGSREGIWNKIFTAALEHAFAIGKLDLEIVAANITLIDSKTVEKSAKYSGHERRKGV